MNDSNLNCLVSSDELPVQLTLPRAMREAKNRQQLSSLALLGQEFWRYPMANPKPPESGSSNTSSLSSFHCGIFLFFIINHNKLKHCVNIETLIALILNQ